MIRPLLPRALLLALCCACSTSGSPKPAPAAPSACERVPLFERYARAGLVEVLPEGRVRLAVVTDAHSADCGTPDCYFTSVSAVFHLSSSGGACQVREVEVSTEEGGCIPVEQRSPSQRESFFAEEASDLADPKLEKLTLRTRKGDRALVVLPSNLFYFTDVQAGGPLHTTLPNDNDDELSCCWGASMSESHFQATP